MRGLLKLTWLEIRIFVREPLGVGAAGGGWLPTFLVLWRALRPVGGAQGGPPQAPLARDRDLRAQPPRVRRGGRSSARHVPRPRPLREPGRRSRGHDDAIPGAGPAVVRLHLPLAS